jgi:hypothetical protein
MRTNNYLAEIVSITRKGCILIASALVLSGSPAQAGCNAWDVGGNWFPQGGDDWSFHLTQKSGVITGSATRGPQSTKVTGTVTGSAFYLHLVSKGLELRGEIAADGKIHGVMHDLSNPNKKLVFSSSRAMKCAEILSTAPAPPPKPVVTGPPPKATPKISASPAVVTIPAGQADGATTLTWDGGPEHPYAEVWVAVNGQDPTFVVEQGKGTRTVTVERGKNYLFILTDSGQQLAKAAVISKR